MSGKSRRRGRRLSRSQRKKIGSVAAAPVVESAAPTAQQPTPAPRVASAVSRAPAAKAAVQTAPPNVSGELKRIGIMGGLMVALLVVAYFVLPLILD